MGFTLCKELQERRALSNLNRVDDKDAFDALRLLREVEMKEMRDCLVHLLSSGVAAGVNRKAIDLLSVIVGGINTEGMTMTVWAAGHLEYPEIIASQCRWLLSSTMCFAQ